MSKTMVLVGLLALGKDAGKKPDASPILWRLTVSCGSTQKKGELPVGRQPDMSVNDDVQVGLPGGWPWVCLITKPSLEVESKFIVRKLLCSNDRGETSFTAHAMVGLVGLEGPEPVAMPARVDLFKSLKDGGMETCLIMLAGLPASQRP